MPAPPDTFAMDMCGPLSDFVEDTLHRVEEKMAAQARIRLSNVGSACGTTSRRSATLLTIFAADA
jgi:hypothetical protein